MLHFHYFPVFSRSFHSFSVYIFMQTTEEQTVMSKPNPNSLSEKISPEQKQQLIVWLADHTYGETQELCAVPPPEGLGMEIGLGTLCRFYKANFHAIDKLRHQNLGDRASEQVHYAEALDDLHRQNLADGSTLLLQERLYELLSRPVETVDDLKKLVYISRAMKELDIQLDPTLARKDRMFKKLMPHPLGDLIGVLKAKDPKLTKEDILDMLNTND